jgi:hypothetical protein
MTADSSCEVSMSISISVYLVDWNKFANDYERAEAKLEELLRDCEKVTSFLPTSYLSDSEPIVSLHRHHQSPEFADFNAALFTLFWSWSHWPNPNRIDKAMKRKDDWIENSFTTDDLEILLAWFLSVPIPKVVSFWREHDGSQFGDFTDEKSLEWHTRYIEGWIKILSKAVSEKRGLVEILW